VTPLSEDTFEVQVAVQVMALHKASEKEDEALFRSILYKSEAARLKAENIRLTLAIHREEHGC
jgi:hypothetical protein